VSVAARPLKAGCSQLIETRMKAHLTREEVVVGPFYRHQATKMPHP